MNSISRRRFIHHTAFAAAAAPLVTAVLAPVTTRAASVGASERIRLGVVGCGGRGRDVLGVFLSNPEVDCDIVRGRVYLDWVSSIGKPADTAPPPGVDYDLWLGPAPKRPFNPNRFHFCVKSRQQPVENLDAGHHVTTVAHLGNIASRTGHKIVWDPIQERIVGDREADKLVGVKYRKPWKLPYAKRA